MMLVAVDSGMHADDVIIIARYPMGLFEVESALREYLTIAESANCVP